MITTTNLREHHMAQHLKCECGRSWSECVYVVQRSGLNRYIFYRCQACSREWEVVETVDDLADPVTSSEILEVHRLLAATDLTLGELTR